MPEEVNAETAGAPARTPTAPGVRLDRLEFGKLCYSPDGPIIGRAEYRVLARTPDFPGWLARLCTPADLGVGRDDIEQPSDQFPHGTVLRPVRADGRIHTVAYRLRQRPEDGEGGEKRGYWLGRYLVADSDRLDPETARAALAAPLVGLRPEDSELHAEVVVPTSTPSPLPRADRRLVLQALTYLLSGIPVGIAAPFEEQRFFQLASALYLRLPPRLQELFSVGWGVTKSLTSKLALSCSDRFSDRTAVFTPGTDSFQPPRLLGASDDAPFTDGALDAGRMYIRVAFAREEGDRVDIDGRSPSLEAVTLPAFVPKTAPASPLAFLTEDGDAVAESFLAVGQHCLDHARLNLVFAWLNGAGADDGNGLCLSSDEYLTDAYKEDFLRRAVAALVTGEHRRRAELALWTTLSSAEAASAHRVLGRLDGPGSGRARLLAALAGGHGDVLEALEDAHSRGEVDDLPDPAMEMLDRRLQATLGDAGGPKAPERHVRLIEVGATLLPYRRWASTQVHALSLLLVSRLGGGRRLALEALARLCDSEVPRLVARVDEGESPAAGDGERLRTGSHPLHVWATEALVKYWRLGSQSRREALLPWLRELPELLADDPMAQLARGEERALALPPERLATMLADGALPASLLPRLAAGILAGWERYAATLHRNPAGWASVIDLFPDAVRWLLVDPVGTPPPSERTPERPLAAEVQQAALALAPPDPRIERVLSPQAGLRAPVEAGRIAPYLWDWSGNAPSARGAEGGFMEVCRALRKRRLPEHLPQRGVAELVVEVAHAGATPEELHEMRDDLWAQVGGPDPLRRAQIQLLLSLYHQEDLVPDARHLAAITPAPRWLTEHLATPGVDEHRSDRFAIALAGFQGLDYQGPDAERWRDEFRQSHLWLVFRNLPEPLRGPLRAGLKAFSEQRSDRLLELTIQWYERSRQQFPESEPRLAECAVREILIPLWSDIGGTETEWSLFGEHLSGSSPGTERKVPRSVRTIVWSEGAGEWPVYPDGRLLRVHRRYRDFGRGRFKTLGAEAWMRLFRETAVEVADSAAAT